jgi:hypothetical protein
MIGIILQSIFRINSASLAIPASVFEKETNPEIGVYEFPNP